MNYRSHKMPLGWSAEEFMERVISNSKDFAVLVADTEGHIVYCNSAAELILSAGEEEILQRSIFDIFTAEDVGNKIPQHEMQTSIEKGSVVDERWHLRFDGSRFWAVGVTKSIKNAQGEVIAFCKIFRNQTLSKFTENKFKEANAQLMEFAYTASHDLQEPLRTMNSYVQLLKKDTLGKLDETANDYIKTILQASERMRNIIKDLLSLVQADEQQAVVELTESNIAFETAVANLAAVIRETSAIVTRGPLPPVRIASIPLQRLFQNLLSNAIKFKRQGIPMAHVSVTTEGANWLFAIRDNGIGIAEKDIPKIFGAFKRLHTSQEYPGTGLGLSICMKIVERHGGKLWVESTPGVGSTFFFTLPKDNRAVAVVTRREG